MSIIYEPRGAAREYSPLAANLYRGCGHGCTYCYAPSCLYETRESFVNVRQRKGVLSQLEKDARKMHGDKRPILLCFTCDPYQPIEGKLQTTRGAIGILGENQMRVRVLTKSALAQRDFDLMKKYDAEFGMSLIWADDKKRKRYEPNAGSVADRIKTIESARGAGIKTWLSIEPVIEPAEALWVIKNVPADIIKVGKLNHNAALESRVNWAEFLAECLDCLRGKRYYIKNELWKYSTPEIRTAHKKQS